MQRGKFSLGLALIAVGVSVGSVHAFGGRGRAQAAPALHYYPLYHVTPVYVPTAPLVVCPQIHAPAVPIYAPTVPRVIPFTPPPIMPYAPTRPAPPSKTTEPPTAKNEEPPTSKSLVGGGSDKRAPKIIETRTSKSDATASRERCKVGFWNITDSDVDLIVAGKTHKLARGRAVTLEVDRVFSWSLGDREPSQERVAEGKEFHEIVLRKLD